MKISWDKILLSQELENQYVCSEIYSFDQKGFKLEIKVVQ